MLELDPDEHRNEADRLLLRVIEAQPYGELAAKAKDLRGSIASRDLRAKQPNGLRQDAVSTCLQALQLFEGMEQQRVHGGAQRGGCCRPGRAADQ